MKILKKIISALITLLIIGYAVIVLIDFFQVRASKEPMVCKSYETHEYADGKTLEYKCLGYKIFKYERQSINAYEFGFFISEKGKD